MRKPKLLNTSRAFAGKVCGVRRPVDAALCIAEGIDFVGFNFFAGSKRFLPPDAACRVWREAQTAQKATSTAAVGVCVDMSLDDIKALLRMFPELSVIQLHGRETPQFCRELVPMLGGRHLWKALPVQAAQDVMAAQNWGVELLLFDAPATYSGFGGTGKRFVFEALQTAQDAQPEIRQWAFGLAGGLKPEDVEIVRGAGACLIDMASGVENSDGTKSAQKIVELAQALKQG